jgi:membrane-bound lytic murein transglycosylase B
VLFRSDTAWSDWRARGYLADVPIAAATPVLLFDLPVIYASMGADAGTEHWLRAGTRNFAAILGYNRSYFYAVSVVELGAAIRSRL